MISEIERGIRNPSITTIWNLANALKKPLNFFLKESSSGEPVIYKISDEQTVSEKGYIIHPLMNFDEEKKFEIYFNDYHPKTKTESSVHYEGVEEYALVASGSLTVTIGNEKYIVKEGEVIHFNGDTPHYYENNRDEIAKAFVLIFYTE
jgi:quercetin dioxygenase-like cupin family protein